MEFKYELVVGGRQLGGNIKAGCFKTREAAERYAKAKGYKDFVIYEKKS